MAIQSRRAFLWRHIAASIARVVLGAWIGSTAVGAVAAHAEGLEFSSSPRGHVLVPLSPGGGAPLLFALDTAAGKTAVTPALVEKLGLEKLPGSAQNVAGIHGLTETYAVALPSPAVGNTSVTRLEALVLDLDHITGGQWRLDGVLGMNFLRQFDLRLNFAEHTLDLFPTASDISDCDACPTGVSGHPFERIDPGFIVLPATVDETRVKALLDTGSGHSGINSRAATAMGVELPPMPAGLPGHHGLALQSGPVRIGDATLSERTTLRVMDHPLMDSLGLADGPAMLLGTDQLAGRTLTICYGLGLVFLE